MKRLSFFWKFYLLSLIIIGLSALYFFYQLPSIYYDSIFGGIAFLSLISAPISYFFYKRTTRPLEKLNQYLSQFDPESPDSLSLIRSDEFGQLGLNISEIVAKFHDQIQNIERAKSELTGILDEFGQGVVALDPDENITYINPEAAEILETTRDDSLGRPIYEIARNEEITEAVSESIQEMNGVQREVNRIMREDDQIIEVNTSLLVERNDDLQGVVLSLNDVTELRRLQTIRQDFVANVSHELKTPLAAIQGLIETLIDNGDMDTKTRVRFMKKIRNQINRMTELTEDLLTISRLESAENNLNFNKIDLSTPVREAVNTREPSIREKGHLVDMDLPGDNLYVEGDASALQQLVGNLLDNAIKYTPEEGVITVSLEESEEQVKLQIEDNGIGIEPRKQERIFERFYRVDEGRSRDEGGTGLGLSIVKHVTLSHEGSISVESTPGQGTCFTVEFPAGPEDKDNSNPSEQSNTLTR